MRIVKCLTEFLFLLVIMVLASTTNTIDMRKAKIESSIEESSASGSEKEGQEKSSYAPNAKSVTRDCFIEERKETIARVSKNLEYFSEILKTAKIVITDEQIQAMTNLVTIIKEAFSNSEKFDFKTNLLALNKFIGDYKVYTDNSTSIIEGIIKNKNTIFKAFTSKLKENLGDKFSPYSLKSFGRYLKFFMTKKLLDLSKEKCFGLSDFQFINPDYIFDSFSMNSLENTALFHPEQCKDKIIKNVGEYFFNNSTDFDEGIAFAFFHKQTLPELKKDAGYSKSIFEVTNSDSSSFVYDVYQKTNIIFNRIRFNKFKNLKSNTLDGDDADANNCGSNIFTIFSIQKESNNYKVIFSMRFPTLNKKSVYSFTLSPTELKKVFVTFDIANVFKFCEYKHTEENEIKTMLHIIRKDKLSLEIEDSIRKCTDKDCKYSENGLCLNCIQSNMLLFNGKCVDRCPFGFFENKKDSSLERCIKCQNGCSQCDEEKCNGCDIKEGYKLLNPGCVKECGDGYYEEVQTKGDVKSITCVKCPFENCSKCNKEQCLKCYDYAYNYIIGKNLTCVSKCPDGTFKNDSTKTCLNCPSNCKKCSNDKTCDACVNLFYLDTVKKTCLEKCPINYTVSTEDPESSVCVKCVDPKCDECQINRPEVCDKCITPNIMIGKNKKCGQALICKNGEYFDYTSEKCEKCLDECETCVHPQLCKTCKDGKEADKGQCFINCPSKKVEINKKCMDCADPSCLKCDKDLNSCFICEAPSVHFNSKCYSSCPEGTFKNIEKNSCEKCDYKCKSCNLKDECLSCNQGFYFFNGKCVNPCPDKYFGNCNNLDYSCEKCHDSCEKCKGNSEKDCITCAKEYYRLNDNCVRKPECPKGTYADDSQRKCVPCDIKYCLECSGPKACEKCMNRFEFNPEERVCKFTYAIYTLFDNDKLFDYYTSQTSKNTYSLQKDANDIGTNFNQISFSFWIRFVKEVIEYNSSNKLTIFTFNTPSTNSTVSFDIINGNCYWTFNNKFTRQTESALIKDGCKSEKLKHWRHFIFSLSLESNVYNVTLGYEEVEKTIIQNKISFNNDNKNLVPSESNIIFNPVPYGTVYHISVFTIREFNPLDLPEYNYVNKKQSICDFDCETCINSQCKKCDGAKELDVPIDVCPAGFVYYHIGNKLSYIGGNVNIKDMLNEGLTNKNYISNNYAFGGWIFLGKFPDNKFTPLQYLTTLYQNNENSYIKDIFNITISESNKLTINTAKNIDIIQTKTEGFYYIMVGISISKITVWTSTITDNYEMKTVIDNQDVVGRLFQDISFDLNKPEPIKSFFDFRFYYNNVPSDKEVINHIGELKLDSLCVKYDEAKKCVECKKGLVLRDEKCEMPTLVHSLTNQTFNFWEEEDTSLKIGQLTENDYDHKFTFSFFFRRKGYPAKIPSFTDAPVQPSENFPFTYPSNVFNVFGLGSEYNSTNLISIRNRQSDNNIEILFRTSDTTYNKYIYIQEDNKEFTFIKFLISVDQNDKTITYFFGDNSKNIALITYKGKIVSLVDTINYLTFGDKTGFEMNFEIILPKFVSNHYTDDKELKVYKDPATCSYNCLECDYDDRSPTKLCKRCYPYNKNEVTNVENCPRYLSGFKYIVQYEPTKKINTELIQNSTVIDLNEEYRFTSKGTTQDLSFYIGKTNVFANTYTYSVSGFFLLYKDLFFNKDLIFNIFSLNNIRESNKFKYKDDKNIRGINFLRLDVIKVNENKAFALVKLKYDSDNTEVVIDNIEFDIKRWVMFYIRVTQGKITVIFEYPIAKNEGTRFFTKSVNLEKLPVPMNEMTSLIKNFGRYTKKLNFGSLFIYMLPNDPGEFFFDSIKSKNSITKDYTKFGYQECSQNCNICSQIFDPEDVNSHNKCLDCVDGKTLYNGVCNSEAVESKIYDLPLDDYVSDKFEYVIPQDKSVNMKSLQINFFVKRNYLPNNFKQDETFFEFGDLSMKISSSELFDNFFVSINNLLTKEKVFEISNVESKKWFGLTISIDATSISIKVYNIGLYGDKFNNPNFEYKKDLSINLKNFASSKIVMDNLNHRISLHTLRYDININDGKVPFLNDFPTRDIFATAYLESMNIDDKLMKSILFKINDSNTQGALDDLIKIPDLRLKSSQLPLDVPFSKFLSKKEKILIADRFEIRFSLKISTNNPIKQPINIMKVNNSPSPNENQDGQISNIISITLKNDKTLSFFVGERKQFTQNQKPLEASKEFSINLTNMMIDFVIVKTQMGDNGFIEFFANAAGNTFYKKYESKLNTVLTNEFNEFNVDSITNASHIYFFDNPKVINEDSSIRIKNMRVNPNSIAFPASEIAYKSLNSNFPNEIQVECIQGEDVCLKCNKGVLNNGQCVLGADSYIAINRYPININGFFKGTPPNYEIKIAPGKSMQKFSFSFSFLKYYFDGNKITSLINIMNDDKIIISLTIDYNYLYIENSLSGGYSKENKILLSEANTNYQNHFKEFYVTVDVDLKGKLDSIYIYNYSPNVAKIIQKKFQSLKLKYSSTAPDLSFVPNKLTYNLGVPAVAILEKSFPKFLIHSLVFNPNALLEPFKDNFRVRYSNKCDVLCKVSCAETDGICPQGKALERKFDMNLEKITKSSKFLKIAENAELYSKIDLFRKIRNHDPDFQNVVYSDEFLITFELNISDFLQINNKNYPNKNLIFSLHNNKSRVKGLSLNDLIPKDQIDTSLLSLELENCQDTTKTCKRKLTLTTGYLTPQIQKQPIEIELTQGKNIQRLSIVIYGKSSMNNQDNTQLYMLIKENNKISYVTPSKVALASLVSADTFIYNHPALTNINLDIVSPNLNDEFWRLRSEKLSFNLKDNACIDKDVADDRYVCNSCLGEICLLCNDLAFLNSTNDCLKKRSSI